MTPIVAVLIAVAIAVVVLVVIARARRSRDGVDSFRRQIDALSPEARRPVVDQVQSAASRIEPRPVGDPDTADDTGEAGDDATESSATTDVARADEESVDGDDTDGGSHGT